MNLGSLSRKAVTQPNVRLHINPVILLNRNMNRYERPRNRMLTRGLKGLASPLSPVSQGAHDHHAGWRDLLNSTACADVDTQPRVEWQSVIPFTKCILTDRGQWFEVFRSWANRREEFSVAEGTCMIRHRAQDNP